MRAGNGAYALVGPRRGPASSVAVSGERSRRVPGPGRFSRVVDRSYTSGIFHPNSIRTSFVFGWEISSLMGNVDSNARKVVSLPCLCFAAAAAFWAALAVEGRADAAAHEPRVAVILCEDTYAASWELAQMSSHALVGLAGLAGVPYDTLLLSELVARPASDYSSVWFSSCPYLSDASMAALTAFLSPYMQSGGTVLLDGPIGMLSTSGGGEGSYRGTGDTEPILEVGAGGWYDIGGYAVHTTDAMHPISQWAGHPAFTPLTQGIAEGLDVVTLVDENAPGSAILLELVSSSQPSRYPYLVVTEPPGGGKVVAISSYGSYVGAATCFRNEASSGFFDNLLLPYLIEAALWLVGPEDEPFVSLLLSHAPMTAIGRLDADWSNDAEATRLTFEYLLELAWATGVVPVYAIVSTFAPEAGWETFRAPGVEIEALAGALGSHSATHVNEMSDELDEPGWAREVAGSLQSIRQALSGPDFGPAVEVFINPGNTIRMGDYGRFFSDVSMFMTHGFETVTPYASGVMGFGLPAGVPLRPVVNNTPAPDFQWLYLSEWGYTVDEAATIQARILDYYQQTVGRGVLYNQMWHDYSIGGNDPPVNDPDAASTLPLYDVNWMHFQTRPIYAPGIAELVDKLHLAHAVRLSSEVDGMELHARLDFSGIQASLVHVASMGLRINHADQPIVAVTVDGMPHPAFTDDTVILPPARERIQEVRVYLDPATPARMPRLTYLSKPLGGVTQVGGELEVTLARPGETTRFCLEAPLSAVVLHADAYAWTDETRVCGMVGYDSVTDTIRTVSLLAAPALQVRSTERAIERVDESATGRVQLVLGAGLPGAVRFAAAEQPAAVMVDDVPVDAPLIDGELTVEVATAEPATITIDLHGCEDADGDGVSTCAGDCDDTDSEITDECRQPPPDPEPPGDGDGDGGGGGGGGWWGCAIQGQAGQGAGGATGSMLLLGVALLWIRRRARAGRAGAGTRRAGTVRTEP